MRAIDADAVPQEFWEYEFDGKWRGCTIKDLLDSQPTIQPKRGKWIMSNVGDTFMTDAPKIIYCSSCNVCAPYATNYCPMCGADMRGEQDDSV